MSKSRRERRAEAIERLMELRESDKSKNVYQLMNALLGETGDGWTVDKDYADLIDLLSEDECHNTLDDDWGTFECSECGTQWEVSPVYIDAGGTSEHDLIIPRHCPNCGCKVVEE